jgi:hypothetical protein
MLPGVRGALVSEYFAEHMLGDEFAGRLGERDRDAARLALARIGRAVGSLGPAASTRAVFDIMAGPLAGLLGFRVESVVPAGGRSSSAAASPFVSLDGTASANLVAVLERDGTRLAMVVVPWASDLDTAWRAGMLAGIDAAARWCLLFNARELRILDSWRSYSRDHLAFDLELVACDTSSFAVFWALARADAFLSVAGFPSLLDAVIALSARHAVGVCRSLRVGVLEALQALMQGFMKGPRAAARLAALDTRGRTSHIDTMFEQSLTLVYRLLFLLFAEARRLMPTWHPVYSASYSMDALRTLAERPGARPQPGVWESFQAMSRLAHRGCRAGALAVTPFNGRLFSPARTPLGESGRLDDDAARRAVVALSTTRAARGAGGRVRIAYQDLGVEELGGVYEGVLDYQPRLERRGPNATLVLEPGSGRRKATGTFYTPRSLTGYLVRRTLHPLVRNLGPDQVLRLRVVDPSMGSGAFLVAACHYLASAYERALVAGGGRHSSDIDERDRARFRRLVAQRCLYGVDLNPTAVQLARLSLWLATLAADHPLTFLDHHLAAGDSLVGASPLDLLRSPDRSARGSYKAAHPALFDPEDVRKDLERVLPVRIRVAEDPGDTPEAVHQKERAIEALGRPEGVVGRWKQAADLWCACWFLRRGQAPGRGVYHEAIDSIVGRRTSLSRACLAPLMNEARTIAATRRFIHWQLAFPEAFFDATGRPLDNPGFDAVIGNPPWDMLRTDPSSQESARAYDRGLFAFARRSGVYTAQSDGHPNRFQLFVERAFQLSRRGGRIGLVVPWGLFADQGCAGLRRRLFTSADTDTIFSFENSKAIFPIHRSLRFALVTATTGTETAVTRCRFRETDSAALDAVSEEPAPADYPLAISPALLSRLSGEDLSVPDVRTPVDLEILERVSAGCPRLCSPDGWHARFGRELNATDDRPYFIEAAKQPTDEERGDSLFVVEGKHLAPFVVMLDSTRYRVPSAVASRLLGRSSSFRTWRLAYRDVASATNRLTLIAAMLPPDCVSTHTVFCLKTSLDEQVQWFLCGVMNSYVANYVVRLRVTTHVSAGIVERLPVPFERRPDGAFEVAQLARQLSAGAGVEAGDRLQALVARMYDLTVPQFSHVLDTFPLVERERRDAALELFRAM